MKRRLISITSRASKYRAGVRKSLSRQYKSSEMKLLVKVQKVLRLFPAGESLFPLVLFLFPFTSVFPSFTRPMIFLPVFIQPINPQIASSHHHHYFHYIQRDSSKRFPPAGSAQPPPASRLYISLHQWSLTAKTSCR